LVRGARPLASVYWNVNLSAKEGAEVPRAVVTVTSTVPADLAGDMAVMEVAELTVNEVTVVVPNFTAETLIRLVPVMVTLVPPAFGPKLGLTPVTVAASWYRNWSLGEVAEVPPALATITSTVPADPAGDVAVIVLAEFTVNEVAGAEPKVTAEAPVKPEPVMVTRVPPASGPTTGRTAVTVGVARYVNRSD
jgi:hypothetical protein